MANHAANISEALTSLEGVVGALGVAFAKFPDARSGDFFGEQANLDAIRTALHEAPTLLHNAALDASITAANRQNATKLVPVSIIYAAVDEQGDEFTETTMPDMRSYKVTDFKGDRDTVQKDSYACIDWLNRLLRLAKKNQLTHEACKELIQLHATHEAGRTVRNAIKDKKTLTQMVIDLEVNYAGLMQPDLAMEACKALTRRDNETLRGFGERVRLTAEMATRNRVNPQEAALQLAYDSFIAALRPTIKLEVRDKLDERRRQGEDETTYPDMVNMAHILDESRAANDKIFRQRKGNASVHRVAEESADEYSDAEDNEEDEDDDLPPRLSEAVRLVRNFTKNKRGRGGKQNFGGGMNRRFNKPAERTLLTKQFEEQDEDGEFLTLHYVKTAEQGGRRLRVQDLNVLPHECARCGIAGHRATGPDANKCPLRMYITQAEPCKACNKGGHEAKVCPRTPNLEKNY